MNTLASARLPHPRRDRFNQLLGVLLIVALGVIAGLQYVAPDKRILAVSMAALVVGIAWRLDTVSAIGLLIIALPYPRGTTFGSTNFALLLLLLLIWLLRARRDAEQAPRRTGVDLPIAGFLIAHIVSFYNVDTAQHAFQALGNFLVFVACIALFYLLVSNVRTTAQLRRIHVFQSISIATIVAFGLYEMGHPGAVIIPGWILLLGSQGTEGINLHDARIGGPFFDYELLAEFAAISLLFTVFRLLQSRSVMGRVVNATLSVALMIIMFATVTRGAVVALAV